MVIVTLLIVSGMKHSIFFVIFRRKVQFCEESHGWSCHTHFNKIPIIDMMEQVMSILFSKLFSCDGDGIVTIAWTNSCLSVLIVAEDCEHLPRFNSPI